MNENLIEESYKLLYPEKEWKYFPELSYSGRFKDYNANARLTGNRIEFRLCKKWRKVSREIQIGLIQELMLRIFKDKRKSTYVDLYNGFVKNLHLAVPKTESHPILEESFNRVNEKYFYGLIEQPNLIWGFPSKSHLGSYDYKRDTIKISKVFTKLEMDMLDFVMYHEILHKKQKFQNKLGSNRYHTSEFRRKEREFENYEEIDKKLNRALSYMRIKDFFFGR